MPPANYNNSDEVNLIRVLLIIGLLVSAYMLYNLTVTLYKNFEVENEIENFEAKIAEGEAQLSQYVEDFQYYTSDEYKEKMAKQNYNLLNPGEMMIIIPEDGLIQLTESEEAFQVTEQMWDQWSNPRKWWEFIFGWNPYK